MEWTNTPVKWQTVRMNKNSNNDDDKNNNKAIINHTCPTKRKTLNRNTQIGQKKGKS